jgi:hypothetical protein
MIRLMRAGLILGMLQAAIALTIADIFWTLRPQGARIIIASEDGWHWTHATFGLLLGLADTIAALGVITTNERVLRTCAPDLANAATRLGGRWWREMLGQAIGVFGLAAAVCAVLSLSGPPAFLASAIHGRGPADLAAAIWPSATSVAFVFFVAIARSAIIARRS